MKTSTAVCLGLTSIIVAFATGAHASAVTIGGLYMESSDRHSRQPPAQTNCSAPDAAVCSMIFNVVPAGKQLFITDVSCTMTVGSNQPIDVTSVQLRTLGTDRASHVAPIRTSSAAGGNVGVFIVNGTVKHLFRAAERPIVQIFAGPASAFFNAACTIAGKVGNPPVD